MTRHELRIRIKELNIDVVSTTLDNYRKVLTELGYLETVSKGKYKLVKKIPNESIRILNIRNEFPRINSPV